MNNLYVFGTGVVNYSYDVNGQRVKKTAGGDTVNFYYDDNGRLIKQRIRSTSIMTITGG